MQFNAITDYLHRCCLEKLFPGAAMGLSIGSQNFLFCSGRLSDESGSAPVRMNCLYDLASVTKPVATATAILHLIEHHPISLDQSISSCLDEFKDQPDKEKITIRHLLTHTSGLAAWEPLYVFASSRTEMVRCIAERPLDYPVGSQVKYSCLGFIVLAELITRVSGLPLSQYCRRNIFDPLEMHDSCFSPPKEMITRIAPTEEGNVLEKQLCEKAGFTYSKWRTERLLGQVHDGNAWTAGGEGGNAGLFSTVSDLLRFGRYCLAARDGQDERILSQTSVVEATINQTNNLSSHRGLGWQMADSCQAVRGVLSDQSFGHTGFTGTSLWIDPVYGIVITLLTNRVYYSSGGDSFNQTRLALHSRIMAAIQSDC